MLVLLSWFALFPPCLLSRSVLPYLKRSWASPPALLVSLMLRGHAGPAGGMVLLCSEHVCFSVAVAVSLPELLIHLPSPTVPKSPAFTLGNGEKAATRTSLCHPLCSCFVMCFSPLNHPPRSVRSHRDGGGHARGHSTVFGRGQGGPWDM